LQGDHDAAHSHLEESVTLWRELGEKQGLAQALRFLSAEFESRGEYALARSLVEESVELFREGPDTFGLGMTLARLGITATNQGDYAVARTALEEGVAICRETEDNRLLSLALRHLAFAALKQGDHERAAALLGESLGVLRGAGEEFSADSIWSLEFLAAAVSVQGESERAARLFGAAEALREALGAAVLYPADRDRGVAAARAGLDEATFAAAWIEGRAMTPKQAVEYALGEVREPAAPPTTAPLPGRTPAGTKKPTETVPAEAKAPQPQLRIFALGASRVEKDEHALASSEWGYAKPKELLFYLLSHPPRTKEQVGLALWPEASTAQLRSNFHVTVYRLRRALGRPEWIVFENGRYAFNRSLSYFFDAEAFELGLAEARRAQAEEAPGRAIARLEEALDLYRGDFLEDLAIEGEWAMVRQEELRRECLDGLLELGRLLFAEGRHEEATVTYRKAIGQEPYLEEAHRGLMLCQARLGERGQALKHYQRLVEMLGEEVGSEPAPETRKLFESLRSGEDA
jgi:DNA-binding SARP family transcriptional activator